MNREFSKENSPLSICAFKLGGDPTEEEKTLIYNAILNYTCHRFPLHQLIVVVSLRVDRTLLKRLMSKRWDFNTQFTYFSIHPGA